MTDTDTNSLPDEKGIRHTLKRYLGPDGVTMILLGLLAMLESELLIFPRNAVIGIGSRW